MAPVNRKWDAYQTLNITNRHDYGMTCVGLNRYGKRCRWDIPDDKYERVYSILDELETKAPSDAASSFSRLAQLSLCQDWHQNQAFTKIREWTTAVQEATQFYDSSSGLEDKIQELEEMLEKETNRSKDMGQQIQAASERILSLNLHTIQQDSALRQAKSDLSTEMDARKRAEKEAMQNEERFHKMVFDHESLKMKTTERIRLLREKKRKESEKLSMAEDALEYSQRAFREKNQELHKLTTKSDWQSKEMKAMSLELEEVDASETVLLAQKFDLTYELEVERHRIVTIESKLATVTNDRDIALLEKGDLRQCLLEVSSTKDMLLEEQERLKLQMDIEAERSKRLDMEKSQVEQSHAALVESMKTMADEFTTEQHAVEDLRKALEASKDGLLSAQAQLRIANEDLSRSKDELEGARADLAKTRREIEEGRRIATTKEGEMRARIEALMQERGYANGHPFRIFFRHLIEKLICRAKSEDAETA